MFKPNCILIYPLRYFLLNTFYLIGVFFVLDEIVSRAGFMAAFENERLLMLATLVSLLQSISAYYKSKQSLTETKNTIAT
jgi:hypothetical protein